MKSARKSYPTNCMRIAHSKNMKLKFLTKMRVNSFFDPKMRRKETFFGRGQRSILIFSLIARNKKPEFFEYKYQEIKFHNKTLQKIFPNHIYRSLNESPLQQ